MFDCLVFCPAVVALLEKKTASPFELIGMILFVIGFLTLFVIWILFRKNQ